MENIVGNSLFNSTDLSKFDTTTEQFLRIICVDFSIRSGVKDIYVTSAAEDIYKYISTGETVKIGIP